MHNALDLKKKYVIISICCLISAKDLFRRFFGEESRTFDYKWLRYLSLLSFVR